MKKSHNFEKPVNKHGRIVLNKNVNHEGNINKQPCETSDISLKIFFSDVENPNNRPTN